jgi:hypothetical protein
LSDGRNIPQDLAGDGRDDQSGDANLFWEIAGLCWGIELATGFIGTHG